MDRPFLGLREAPLPPHQGRSRTESWEFPGKSCGTKHSKARVIAGGAAGAEHPVVGVCLAGVRGIQILRAKLGLSEQAPAAGT